MHGAVPWPMASICTVIEAISIGLEPSSWRAACAFRIWNRDREPAWQGALLILHATRSWPPCSASDLRETGDGCRSPSIGRNPIIVAGAGMVGILRELLLGACTMSPLRHGHLRTFA